jgi:hypothetical protein
MKRNCWEFKGCGREAGGMNATEMGICPAYVEQKLNGVHEGKNAGRSCWVVAGTFCGDRVQGTFAEKERTCLECDFYKNVRKEEQDFLVSRHLLETMTV